LIFDYPEPRAERIHGPMGYSSYESFRPWLRDEFTFRCTFCLIRETWGRLTGEFELDHFNPQSLAPDNSLDYFNLVYSCRRCNQVKLNQLVPDRQLDLNSPKLMKWRVLWMRIIDLANERDPTLYRQLTGFPDDLPNLSQLRPPKNSKPDGIRISWYAKRQRGQLPDLF